MEHTETQGIISLEIENIKKIKAIRIRPNGGFVEITGRNGQGKSTVLDSIWWALKGKDNIQTAPIRNGEEKGSIRLELGNFFIERTFRRNQLGNDYTTKITVTTKDRAVMKSPQAVLDGFTGMLGFDPLAFMRQTPREQYDTLRGLCKLEVDVEELDRQYKELFAKRTDVNRDVKAAQVRLENMKLPENAPTERVDVSALVEKVNEINAKNSEIAQKQRLRQMALADNLRRREKATQLQSELEKLKRQTEIWVSQLDEETAKANKAIAEYTEFLKANRMQDPAEFTDKIKQAEQINSIMDLRDRRHFEETALHTAQKHANELTEEMQNLQLRKKNAIESAKLPVSGLEFGEEELLLNGVPLAQLSAAEQLKLSMDIAMAENPKLKVVLLKDASLLDKDSMEYIRARAEKEGYQVWAERVESNGAVGFTIENGELKHTED